MPIGVSVWGIQEGTVLTDVALFIDQNKDSLQPIAETKVWWWWWGG